MHIFNVSITTVQSMKNVSLKVWEELITQSRCHLFKTCWKNDKVHLNVNFSKNLWTLPKCHMLIFNVSITTMQGLKNVSKRCGRSWSHKVGTLLKTPTCLPTHPPIRPPGIHHSISRMHFVQPGQNLSGINRSTHNIQENATWIR
jgi:hypothetical protein